MRSHTDTLVSAMMIRARDIRCEDGVATAAIAEAGARLLEQRDEIARLRMTDAEREAVEIAAEYVGSAYQAEHHAAALRGLLARTK